MGNPSNAVTDVNQPTNYLMEKAQYALSYHRDNGTPNWVSWHLDSSWLGSTSRQNDFRPDTTLPSNWYRVTSNDYAEPNYDRGHMTPSGDRTRTTSDNSATFLMTNMIPQAPVNNQQTWANLESYCRTLATSGSEV
jgi:endonuclease G